MSYRECRSLCEMLRALNYNRIVSLQNFSKPNFELIADILYWLAQKYDPQTDISDDINEQKDRVEFMRTIVSLFAVKARIKLNPKKLYQADSDAVTEILKITSLLYKASNSKATEEEQATAFTLPAKVSNLKAHKVQANQICDLGARLYDSISRQPDLKKVRQQAIEFLDGMSGVNDGTDQAYIENCIRTIMGQQDESTREMAKYVNNMEGQQRNLQQKLKKKSAELERSEKRYRNLITVKPAFMEQYERLEQQLAQLQETYVNKYRNLDYLQSELQTYNKIEEQKFKKAKKAMDRVRKQQEMDDYNKLTNLQEVIPGMDPEEDRAFTRGNSRKDKDAVPGRNGGFGGHAAQDPGVDENSDSQDSEGDEIDDGDDDEDDESDF